MAHFIALPQLPSSSSSLIRLNSLDLAGRALMDGDCSATPIVSNLFQALDLARETGSVEARVASSSSSQLQETLESGPAPLGPRRVVDLAHNPSGRRSRLIEAVQNGDVERVRALLERGKISEQEAEEAAKIAANSGHREILELFAALSDAAESAAPKEDQAVLEEEWVPIDFLAQDHFDRIVEECDVPALRLLSATSKKIREFCLGTRSMMAGFTRGVIRALEAGNRDEAVARAAQVRAFGGAFVRELSEYEMPRRAWSETAWNHALQMDDPEILSAFVSSTNMPSDWTQGSRLLIEAAKSGNQRVVGDVLSQQWYFDSRSLAAALLAAAERGDEAIVEALLARKAIGMDVKISAIKAAGKAGHAEVVRVLLVDAGYFIPVLTEVFQAMAERAENLTEILKQLIEAKKVSEDKFYLLYSNQSSRRNAIRAAIRRGYNEIAKVLFPSEKILQERKWYASEERVSAIQESVESGNLRMLRWLQPANFSEKKRGKAVVAAARAGHLKIMRALLDSGEISQTDRRLAIKESANSRDSAMIELLLATSELPRSVFSEIVQAIEHCNLFVDSILDILLGQNRRTLGYAIWAGADYLGRRQWEYEFARNLEKIAEGGYTELLKALLDKTRRFDEDAFAKAEKLIGQGQSWRLEKLFKSAGYSKEISSEVSLAFIYLKEEDLIAILRSLLISNHDQKMQDSILSKLPKDSRGHLKALRKLFEGSNIHGDSTRSLFSAVDAAARAKKAETVKTLIVFFGLPEPIASEIAQFMMQDVKRGQKILEYLVLQPGYAWGIRDALNQAIAKGYREIVRVLGSSEEVDYIRSDAIWTAVKKRDLEMVRALRPENLSISTRGTVTTQAAGLDSLEMIEALVSSGEISGSDRRNAIQAAAKRGDVKMVQILEPEKSSEKKRGTAIWQIAQEEGASLAVVQALIRSGGISGRFAYRTWAIEAAAKRGDVKMMQLLEPEKLSQKERGEAISRIVQEGATLEVIRVLLQSGEITLETRGLAIVNAAKKGDLDTIKLLEPEKILKDKRGDAVGNAVERGDLEMVQVLLGSGRISDIRRWLASHDAAKKKDLQILEALLISAGRFSQSVISQLLQVAEQGNSGLYDIFRCLLYPKDRTEDQKDQALKAAEKGRYTEIAHLLRSPMQRVARAVKDIVYPDFLESGSSGNRAGVSSASPQRVENRNAIARIGARGDIPDRSSIVMAVAFGALIAAGAYALTRGSGHSNAVAKIVGDLLGRFSKR